MKFLKTVVILSFFLLHNSFSQSEAIRTDLKPIKSLVPKQIKIYCNTNGASVKYISLINLIVNPEKYHNREIIVAGFLNLQFEGNAIYLHREDYENGLSKNGFWVSFCDIVAGDELSEANGNYVMLRGRFDAKRAGHFGLYGAL